MGLFMYCGVMCTLMSIWGIIQLGLMGLFYYMEAVTLVEDVEPPEHDYHDSESFMTMCSKAYRNTAINCAGAAIGYVVTLGISLWCVRKAKKRDAIRTKKQLDDELSCVYPPLRPMLDVDEIKKKERCKRCKKFLVKRCACLRVVKRCSVM